MAALQDRSGAVVSLLDVTTEGHFAANVAGFYEYRWTPTASEQAAINTYCTPNGALKFATSIWFEDIVGHTAPPERVFWRAPIMRVTVNQSKPIPLGRPIDVLVHAQDAATAASLTGTVKIDGQDVGVTDRPFTYTFNSPSVNGRAYSAMPR
jgi:hypothetical protein